MKKVILLCVAIAVAVCFTGCSYSVELLNYADDLNKLKEMANDKGLLEQKTNQDNVTPVMYLISMKKPEAAKILVQKGANLNWQDRWGQTAPMYALEQGYDDLLWYMISKKPDLDVQTNDTDYTILWLAINKGNMRVLKWLVDAGADVNHKSREGDTPLAFAVYKNDVKIVSYLLSSKTIKPDAPARDGVTPLMFAAQNGNAQIISMLIKSGAKPNAANKDGLTPMHGAASSGKVEAIKALIKAGAKIDVPEKGGATPLMAAVNSNSVPAAELLIKYKAKINAQNKDGLTPLLIAVTKNNKEMVSMLLSKGADKTIKDKNGNSAKKYAEQMKADEIIKLLSK